MRSLLAHSQEYKTNKSCRVRISYSSEINSSRVRTRRSAMAEEPGVRDQQGCTVRNRRSPEEGESEMCSFMSMLDQIDITLVGDHYL
jgi:hypothetical protein